MRAGGVPVEIQMSWQEEVHGFLSQLARLAKGRKKAAPTQADVATAKDLSHVRWSDMC